MATSHKRETARRTPRAAVLAGSLAVLATGAVVSAGVMSSPAPEPDLVAVDRSASSSSGAGAASAEEVTREAPVISRGSARGADAVASRVDRLVARSATARAIAKADTKLWTTSDLNLWTRPDKAAKQVGEIESGERVLVTGRKYGERVEIVVGGKSRWVTAGHLDDEKPLSIAADCTNGTSVPSGVSANIKKVHQAVCANFPEISTYGTLRSDGEHSQGIAVDIMVSGARGWEVAEFVRANYVALGVNYLIHSRKIWSVQRSGEDWRGMSDRGSVTANHYDHVHVTTY